jgi:hypothetical protein
MNAPHFSAEQISTRVGRLRDSTSAFSTCPPWVGQVENLTRKGAVKLFTERTAL